MWRVHYELTDSTNIQARQIAAQQSGECLLVTADEQTAGRGRQGRHWESPRGGAWMSLAWPMRNEPRMYGAVSLVAAVAVLRAISDLVPECADLLQVKWPNDVLLNERKVAGILCEQTLDANAKSHGTLIIGVGVNVNFNVAMLPTGLRHPATTLRQASNRAIAVDDVINAVSARLVQMVSNYEAEGLAESLLQELQSRLAYMGTLRTFELAGRKTTGLITGIDPVGRLMIRCADGDLAFASGELLVDEGDTDQLVQTAGNQS